MPSTPILNLESDPPKPEWSWSRLIGFVVLIALVLPPILAPVMGAHVAPLNWLLWLLAIYISVAIHEIGHLAAGRLAGIGSRGMSVGGFTVFKSAGRWNFRFDARQCLIGGFAMPSATKDDVRIAPYAWLVAGGPIASVLLAVAVAFAAFRFGGAWTWLGTLLWGALRPLSSLVPMSSGENLSDMARLWQFFRRPEQFRQWVAFLALQTEDSNGTLPRDWDRELVKLALDIDPSETHYAAAQMFSYYRSVDLGDGGAALGHLENALAAGSRRGSKKLRLWCYLDAASECARRSNPAHARIWLERARKLDRPESVANIEAEIAMCEGHYEDALHSWANVRKFIARQRSASGLTRFVSEQVAKSEGECLAAIEEGKIRQLPIKPAIRPSLAARVIISHFLGSV